MGNLAVSKNSGGLEMLVQGIVEAVDAGHADGDAELALCRLLRIQNRLGRHIGDLPIIGRVAEMDHRPGDLAVCRIEHVGAGLDLGRVARRTGFGWRLLRVGAGRGQKQEGEEARAHHAVTFSMAGRTGGPVPDKTLSLMTR